MKRMKRVQRPTGATLSDLLGVNATHVSKSMTYALIALAVPCLCLQARWFCALSAATSAAQRRATTGTLVQAVMSRDKLEACTPNTI